MRQVNPLLAALGFDPRDRVVILHVDDVGMCQATLPAVAELAAAGRISSCSLMVPCPWFSAAAEYCRSHPGLDVGVHLTLTSEWSGYRWAPISTRDPASGLVDGAGYLHPDGADLAARADPAAAGREMAAQVTRARAAGLDLTHVDSHMMAVFTPALLPAYLEAARQADLPPLLWRPEARPWFDPGDEAATDRLLAACRRWGTPLVDGVVVIQSGAAGEGLERARRTFDALGPGLTHVILHPAADTPELRAMTPRWRQRVSDYEVFRDPRLHRHLIDRGIQVIGYRALRDVMGGATAAAG